MDEQGRPIDLENRDKRVDLKMDQLPYGYPIHLLHEPINDPTAENERQRNMGGYEYGEQKKREDSSVKEDFLPTSLKIGLAQSMKYKMASP